MIFKNNIPIFLICLLSLLLAMACSNQGSKTTETAASHSQKTDDTQNDTQSDDKTQTCEQVDANSLKALCERVEWPEEPSGQNASYKIKSGVNDNVWVEGKGYFKMSIKDAYKHFIDPQITGPLHMTKDFERSHFSENDGCASFLLKVKMRYILSIEFELSHKIQPLIEDGEDIGFVMNVKKSGGTSHIKKIDNTFIVKKINDDYVSIEAQSLNKATMDKPDETREAIEGLFERLEAKAQP